MKRSLPIVAATVATAAFLAIGVAFTRGGDSSHYTLDAKTRQCLAPLAALEPDNVDVIAASSTGGALYVLYRPGVAATVSFNGSTGAAKREAAFLFAGAAGAQTIERDANVVVAWDGTPTTDEAAGLRRCIEGGI